MSTMARTVAELADCDGSSFPEEFVAALEAAPRITFKKRGESDRPIRYEWKDGSAIIVCGDMWDFAVHRDRLAEAAQGFVPEYRTEDLLPDGDPTPEYLVQFALVESFEFGNDYEEAQGEDVETPDQPGVNPAETETDTARIMETSNGNVQRVIPPGHILHDEFIEDDIVEEYWVPDPHGSVYLVTQERHGVLGSQVCVGLQQLGYTIEASRESLLDTIRRHHTIEMHNARAAASIYY